MSKKYYGLLFCCFVLPIMASEGDIKYLPRISKKSIQQALSYAIIPTGITTKLQMELYLKEVTQKISPSKKTLLYMRHGAMNYTVFTGIFTCFFSLSNRITEIFEK